MPLSLVLLLLAPAQAPAYPKADAVDALLVAAVEQQQLVGTAVAVIDAGRVVWAKGYGFADRESRVAVDPAATSFRWASISKPVTAVVALQLAERGRLDLDADVRGYVPEFPDKGVAITARHLLGHRGGIVHYANGPVVRTPAVYADLHPFADVVTALDRFKDSPMVGRPGERYAYTTHGYVLLSAVVERAGRQRFADQVRERVAGPLGLTAFRPDYHWEDIPNRAVGYTRGGGAISRRPADRDPDVSWKLGGGGFTSPVTDLAWFGAGLLRRGLVSEATERAMWAAVSPDGRPADRGYGLGFAVGRTPGGVRWVGHSGSQEKTRTWLLLDPVGRRGVAVMTNSEWADLAATGAAVLDAIR